MCAYMHIAYTPMHTYTHLLRPKTRRNYVNRVDSRFRSTLASSNLGHDLNDVERSLETNRRRKCRKILNLNSINQICYN